MDQTFYYSELKNIVFDILYWHNEVVFHLTDTKKKQKKIENFIKLVYFLLLLEKEQ